MSECVKCRYWRVRVQEGVKWLSLLPRSCEVWRIEGASVSPCSGVAYVVRYLNPVSERPLKKLPVVSYQVWSREGRELGDKAKYKKVKYQDAKTYEFFKQFRASTKCDL